MIWNNLTGYIWILFGNYTHCVYSLINKIAESQILNAIWLILDHDALIQDDNESKEFDYMNLQLLKALKQIALNDYEQELSKISCYYSEKCIEEMTRIRSLQKTKYKTRSDWYWMEIMQKINSGDTLSQLIFISILLNILFKMKT